MLSKGEFSQAALQSSLFEGGPDSMRNKHLSQWKQKAEVLLQPPQAPFPVALPQGSNQTRHVEVTTTHSRIASDPFQVKVPCQDSLASYPEALLQSSLGTIALHIQTRREEWMRTDGLFLHQSLHCAFAWQCCFPIKRIHTFMFPGWQLQFFTCAEPCNE